MQGAVGAAERAYERIRRAQHAGINSGGLAGTESLDAIAGVRLRRVPLPAEAVIQDKVRFQFPGVLGEESKLRGANIHRVGRTLAIRVGETEQIVGDEAGVTNVVRPAAIEVEASAYVVKVQLVQTLVADVRSELQGMLADDAAVGVHALINVSCLGEVSGLVVAKSKST